MTEQAPTPKKSTPAFPEAQRAPKRRATKLIVIHCAATKPKADFTAADINQWHLARGFDNGIGYHFVIRRNGLVETGRPIDAVGAHAKGVNATSIGICLIGGLDEDDDAVANYTETQWKSLHELVQRLLLQFKGVSVIGHCDVPGTHKTCPNFNVANWFSQQGFRLK